MQLAVGELDEYLAKREEDSHVAKLGQFSVSDDASELKVTDGTTSGTFALDETAVGALTKYLKVPTAYYNRLETHERAQVLRWEFEKHSDVDTTVETLNKDIVAVHQPSQIMLPLARVAGVITKTFKPEDSIRRMITNDSRFHVDVTTAEHKVAFPLTIPEQHPNATGGQFPPINLEKAKVGDVTEAGVRLLAYPFKNVQPSVNLYAERLVCLNGQTTDERLGRITLKGNTVDEVITEMETAAQLVLAQADEYLQKLAQTRTMEVPGSPQAFAAQLAKEAKLSRKVLDAVLDVINQLPEPVTVWDINQAFTSVANKADHYPTLMALQTVGGSLAFDAESAVARCKACERKL